MYEFWFLNSEVRCSKALTTGILLLEFVMCFVRQTILLIYCFHKVLSTVCIIIYQVRRAMACSYESGSSAFLSATYALSIIMISLQLLLTTLWLHWFGSSFHLNLANVSFLLYSSSDCNFMLVELHAGDRYQTVQQHDERPWHLLKGEASGTHQ